MKPSSDCDYGNPHFHLSRSVFLPFLSLLFVLSCFSYFTYASTPCLQSVMDCCNAYASSINTHTHQDVELVFQPLPEISTLLHSHAYTQAQSHTYFSKAADV